jgi:hypothetical protein
MNIQELTQPKESVEYPNILIENPDETFAVVFKSLEKGKMQVHMALNGQQRCIGRISMSPKNIHRILRVHKPIRYNMTSTYGVTITNIEDYLEVM